MVKYLALDSGWRSIVPAGLPHGWYVYAVHLHSRSSHCLWRAFGEVLLSIADGIGLLEWTTHFYLERCVVQTLVVGPGDYDSLEWISRCGQHSVRVGLEIGEYYINLIHCTRYEFFIENIRINRHAGSAHHQYPFHIVND